MVNECIRAAVIDSGLKQRFIADAIGMSEPTLSAVLSGKRKVDVDEFFSIDDVIVVSIFPDPQIFVDHVAVDQGRRILGSVFRVFRLSIGKRLSELLEGNDGYNRRCQAKDQSDRQDYLCTEGEPPLGDCRKVDPVSRRFELLRIELVDNEGKDRADYLVRNVYDESREKLRDKGVVREVQIDLSRH